MPKRLVHAAAKPKSPPAVSAPVLKQQKAQPGNIPALPAVRLVTASDKFEVPCDLLDQISIYWSYVVRTRSRWSSDKAAHETIITEARTKLAEWGITQPNLQKLADAGVVEVHIPFETEQQGWAARILPWEFLLSTATRGLSSRSILVVRHLVLRKAPEPRRPQKMLFVQSAPGALREFFAFDAERRIVESSLGLKSLNFAVNPTRETLAARIRLDRPEVVHVSAIDLHQGRALLGATEDLERQWDGVYLAGESGGPEDVTAEAFGPLFKDSPPQLVACNFYHSAARVAALTVASGVRAAIGFQDEVDDRLAERFYGAFYRNWRAYNWDLLAAFREAMASIAGTGKLRGTGVVLWTAESLVHRSQQKLSIKFLQERQKSLGMPVEQTGTGSGSAREWFAINVRPPKQINYSLLHNRERLFEQFSITKLRPGYVDGIQVYVELYVGGESFPYRTSVAMAGETDLADLAASIHVPLLSRFLRSNRENVNTCLYVEVKYGQNELYRDTFPVTLLAVDEWKFDPNDDSKWLASFVVPRDPAVLRIIGAAQRYVTALRDDIGAGFDGYQSVDPDADDPDFAVDLQVRAIWAALVNDLPLSYINPPPTFTEDAQRLRVPTDVMSNGRGTCIDLALLFASCLEYVDVYPVVFVLKDHAFPGYWRNLESHERYAGMKAAKAAGLQVTAAQKQSLTPYDEVMQLVNSGDLVPLETVWLTKRLSFQEAVNAGLENLINREDFGALLDVKRARMDNVTPLPFAGGLE